MKSNPKKGNNNSNKKDIPQNKTQKGNPLDLENIIPAQAKPIISKLPQEEQEKIKAQLIALSIQKSWSGPLPSPDTLKEYNNAFPNAAEKIYNMSNRQSEHRIELENLAISSELKQSARGQYFGLIIALSFFIGSFILICLGHEISGSVVGTVDIVGLVSVFVIGKHYQKKNLKEKSES